MTMISSRGPRRVQESTTATGSREISPHGPPDAAARWVWVGQYSIAILLALFLGAILGALAPFKSTILVGTTMRASRVVQFMAYGGALLFFWLFARRAAFELEGEGKGLTFLSRVATPLSTLVVVSASYDVLLLIVGPLLLATGRTIYNRMFVLGISIAAVWFILSLFRHSALLIESMQSAGQGSEPKAGGVRRQSSGDDER